MNKEIMKTLGFTKEVEAVENNICPNCFKPINLNDFTTKISLKEYKISGFCVKCQNDFFTDDE